MGQKYGRSMGTIRRSDLKPAKKQSDEEFLRRAAAAASRAERARERARRIEATEQENRRARP
jgi:hypothetical protein